MSARRRGLIRTGLAFVLVLVAFGGGGAGALASDIPPPEVPVDADCSGTRCWVTCDPALSPDCPGLVGPTGIEAGFCGPGINNCIEVILWADGVPLPVRVERWAAAPSQPFYVCTTPTCTTCRSSGIGICIDTGVNTFTLTIGATTIPIDPGQHYVEISYAQGGGGNHVYNVFVDSHRCVIHSNYAGSGPRVEGC